MRRTLLVGILWLAPGALGQPSAPPAVSAPAEPATQVRDYYLAAPRADRLSVTVTTPEGKSAKASLMVRTSPGDAAATPPVPASIRLTLGPLEVFARDRRLVATHRGNDDHVLIAEASIPLTAQAIRDLLPPVPLPHLAWLLDRSANPHPYGTAAEPAPGRPGEFSARDGEVSLDVDAKSGRARSITLVRRDGVRVQVEFTPIDPGDPTSWALDPGSRAVVASLDQLRPKARPGLAVGARVPELSLLDRGLVPLSFPDLARDAAKAKPAHAPWVWVIVLPCPADGAPVARRAIEDLDAALNAAAIAWGTPNPPAKPALIVVVGAFPLGAIDPDALAKRHDELADLASRRQDLVPVRVAFSPRGKDLLDDLAPGSAVASVVVDGSMRVQASATLDGLFENGKSDATVRWLLAIPTKTPGPDATGGSPK